jgi:DNA-binding transcriptional regulator YiaG
MLSDWGLGLRKAHETMTRLAAGEVLPVWLPNAPEPSAMAAALGELGVAAEVRRPPEVDVKAIRTRLGLTQKEFAARFGLDVDSIQNWEQGRFEPDRSSRILLKIIELNPKSVDEVYGA